MNDTPRPKPLPRVALIGCGAVARHFYLPVLAGHPELEVVALVDRDLERAQRLAGDYAVVEAHDRLEAVFEQAIDAAIVCTPPAEHAAGAIALVSRGVHVLVEKPIAPSVAEAEAMLARAEEARAVLAVGLATRLLPSTRLLRAVLESGWLGHPLGFDLRHGAPYGWPSATLGSMQKDLAGGGVLLDSGVHILDQLAFCFGDGGRVRSYRGNALGGVESDAVLDLEFDCGGARVPGTIELSRTRTLRNTLDIECERGTIELGLHERHWLRIRPADLALRDAASGELRDHALRLAWDAEPELPLREVFRLAIDDFLGAIREKSAPQLSARSALISLRLIEDAYRSAQPLVEAGCEWSGPTLARAPAPRRVLVTGASGFLGARVAEVLRLYYGWDVRAALHTPAHASRVARLPVELVAGDLRSLSDVERWVSGCSAVVHCAVGDTRAATVDGTRHLAEAALGAGVERFVHISSIAVYGLSCGATLEESMPLRPRPGDEYAESKAAAEAAVLLVGTRGLAAVILRPARIYGPWSEPFVIRPLRDLGRGALAVARSAAGAPAQQVFVDNVVFAIASALEAPAAAAAGQAFNVNDADQQSLAEFYGFFADAAGSTLPVVDDPAAPRWATSRPRAALGRLRRLGRRVTGLLAAPEFRAAGKRVAQALPPIAGRRLGLALPVYVRPEVRAPRGETLLAREASISTEKVERVLGYRQLVTTPEGLERTLEWARYAELVPPVQRSARRSK